MRTIARMCGEGRFSQIGRGWGQNGGLRRLARWCGGEVAYNEVGVERLLRRPLREGD